MQPKLVEVRAFTVAGITVRTRNADESDGDRAKLPAHWGRFFKDRVAERVDDRIPESPIFGVYSRYESDRHGLYDLTAGVGVASSASHAPRVDYVDVHGGRYLVFEAHGPLPDAVIDGWKAVWNWFDASTEYKRAYTTDFEAYRGPDDVAIHIAVV
jgi:predicted transcriptional regulator YdeE